MSSFVKIARAAAVRLAPAAPLPSASAFRATAGRRLLASRPTPPSPPPPSPPPTYVLLRQDDNGSVAVMARFATRADADAAVAEYTERGHKQTYWVVAGDLHPDDAAGMR